MTSRLVGTMLLGYSAFMRTLVVSSILLLAAASVMAVTELYKWTDKDGVVHYSDQPAAGAETIRVQDVPTLDAPNLQGSPAAAAPPEAFVYEAFRISNPPPDGTVRDNTGAVSVSLDILPPLRVDLGHTIRVSLGAQTQGGTTNQFTFTGIDRGTHTVQASVIDGGGNAVATSSSTFTLHRVSALLPKNPPPPAGGASPPPGAGAPVFPANGGPAPNPGGVPTPPAN